MILKKVVSSVLALFAVNALAGTYIHYVEGKPIFTNIDDSSVTYTKKVKVNNSSQKISTSEVVARPSVRKTTFPTDKPSSKDTYIKTDNNVAKYYKPLPWSQSQMQDFEYRKGLEKVEVIRRSNAQEAHDLMLSNGYSLLGVSQFFDRELLDSVFIAQAEKVGAKSVVVQVASSSGISYSEDTIDPNTLPFVYQYHAAFYVKNNSFKRPNMLGISIDEIPLDKRNKYQRNTGVYLVSVTKGSRAYIANIIPEDVIIAVNGKNIITKEGFVEIRNSELKISKNLVFTIIRLVNNEPKEIQISIDFT